MQVECSCDEQKIVERQEQEVHKNFQVQAELVTQSETSQTLRKEAKEGKTYETSVGLNLDTNATQPLPLNIS